MQFIPLLRFRETETSFHQFHVHVGNFQSQRLLWPGVMVISSELDEGCQISQQLRLINEDTGILMPFQMPEMTSRPFHKTHSADCQNCLV